MISYGRQLERSCLYSEKVFVCICFIETARMLHQSNHNEPFKDEAQTALFKDPVRTAL